MTIYYDDNFGVYNVSSQEDQDFYRSNQAKSVLKTCAGCRKQVRLLPQYAYCNSCANKIEQGIDLDCED